MSTLTIDGYQLANHADYRERLLGTPAAYTTPNGTRVVGTIKSNAAKGGS